MGGPWRDRSFDPQGWRPPAPRSEVALDPTGTGSAHDHLTGIVIGYVAAVVTSVAVMVGFLKYGW